MPIPARFRLKPVSKSVIRKFSKICDEIENGVNHGTDVSDLLAQWHRHANRKFDPHEFTAYYGAVSTEEFVKSALLPVPTLVEDLAYEELKSVLQAVSKAELESEAEQSYFLEWLDANLPNSNISDLIYWPNAWFKDESAFRDENGRFKPESELNDDQILRYAMLKSGRVLPDAPEGVPLPFRMPE